MEKPSTSAAPKRSFSARQRRFSGRPGKFAGFSLIETLVAIVVMTFGLLGMVGMQAASLQANRDARLQSSALSLGRELADMMRGNRAVAVLTTNNPYLVSSLTPTTASYCLNVSGTACANATAIANAQMTEWLSRVSDELPGARVVSCFDSAPFDSSGLPRWSCTSGTGAIAVIKIAWTRNSTDKSLTGASALELTSDTNSRPIVVLPLTAGSAS